MLFTIDFNIIFLFIALNIENRLKAFEAKIESRLEEKYAEIKEYVKHRCSKYNTVVNHALTNELQFPIRNDEEMAKQEEKLLYDDEFRNKMVKNIFNFLIYTSLMLGIYVIFFIYFYRNS